MKFFKLFLFLGLVPFLTACGVEQIDEGYRGVYQRWGAVEGDPLLPGIYFYNPISGNIMELPVLEQKLNGTTESFTVDNQKAHVTYVLTFRPRPEVLGKLYASAGKGWADQLIPQVVLGAMKDSIGQIEANDLVRKREQVTMNAQKKIGEALEPRGVLVTRLDFVNLNFEPEYEKAVEAKVTAIQNANAEKNRTVQIREQAAQTVLTAEAAARAMQIQTAALQQSASLVEYERVKKWDGKLPDMLIMGGGSATPIIDMSGALGRKK